MTQSRQLAAIMFTDIVGYTSLMGEDSAKALELVRLSKEIQKPLVEKYHGQWLKEMGDGALAKFGTALDAVNCAIEIQELARAKFDGKLRIGIHSGDITIENEDVYGDGVNIASRLQAIADPGGIYISESIEKAIRGQSEVQAKYLGEIKLKNVSYDVRTYAVQGVGLPVPEVKDEKGLSGHLWAEIQRRGLIRTTFSYLVVGILLILLWNQIKVWGVTFPQWSFNALITLIGIGLPVSLFLAWNYERSPQGFVKTSSRESWQNPLKSSQRKPFTGSLMIGIVIAVSIVIYISLGSLPEPDRQLMNATLGKKSIAVLPFRNDSPNDENEYFGNGMLEEVLDKLHKIGELNVLSRTAVEGYRNTDKDPKDIAEELGVENVVEGSVRMYQNRFRVTVQLIQASTGYHLWSEVFDGTLSDTVFIVQSRIAQEVADQLNASITPFEQQQISKIKTENFIAYEKYIKGREALKAYWRGYGEEWKNARNLFQEAVAIDPEFANGYAGLAELYNSVRFIYNIDSVNYYADKALELDPYNGWGYLFKSEVFYRNGIRDQAMYYIENAIEVDPKHPYFQEYLGRLYCTMDNNFTKGIPYLQRARDLYYDQKWNNLELFYGHLGYLFYDIGDYSRAEQYLQTAVDLGAGCQHIHQLSWLLRQRSGQQTAFDLFDSVVNESSPCTEFVDLWKFNHSIASRNFDQARVYLNKHLETGGQLSDFGNLFLAYMELETGSDRNGRKLLEQVQRSLLQQVNNSGNTMWLDMGHSMLYALKGEKAQALQYLEAAAEKGFRWGWHDTVTWWPCFESLWSDPEFKAIVQKAQDEKAALRKQVNDLKEKDGFDLMPI